MSLGDDIRARVEAAAEPVAVPPLGDLLDALAAFVRRYVVLSPAQADVIAVWVAHTHAIDAAETTPYLHVTSAEKRSGKTRLLEVLELVVRAPVRAADVSDAVLFRLLSEGPRTLLLDEADVVFSPRSGREELRGLLNASWRRGSPVYRMVGEGAKMRPVSFDAYGPKAIAGIGQLPDTIEDRSFRIRLARKSRDEEAERFRQRVAAAEAEPIRAALEAWAREAIATLELARPELPDELDDRGQDAAEPLLAIAELAGGDWPARARRAFVELRRGDDVEEGSLGVRLLADCRRAFELEGADRLTTATLLERLAADEEAPWAEWYGRPLTARALAKLLRPYGIRSKVLRIGDATPRGFERAAFEDAWRRYLPPDAPVSATSATLAQPCGFSPDSQTQHEGALLRIENPDFWLNQADVADVADRCAPGEEGRSGRSAVGDTGEEEELTLRLDGRYCTACRDHERCERERYCAEVRRLAELDRRRRERSAQSARRSEPTLDGALYAPWMLDADGRCRRHAEEPRSWCLECKATNSELREGET